MNNINFGLVKRLKTKKRIFFKINKSIINLKNILSDDLPSKNEIYKLISFDGGFASISFISYIAQKEGIEELTASTLRIGEKQFKHLTKLSIVGKLKKASFFLSSMMKMDNKQLSKYNYLNKFQQTCKLNKWNYYIVNNHSKIILCRTQNNYYIIETSSNLNENPKIEQYSFENCKELYDFYYDFFKILKYKVKNDN